MNDLAGLDGVSCILQCRLEMGKIRKAIGDRAYDNGAEMSMVKLLLVFYVAVNGHKKINISLVKLSKQVRVFRAGKAYLEDCPDAMTCKQAGEALGEALIDDDGHISGSQVCLDSCFCLLKDMANLLERDRRKVFQKILNRLPRY